MPSLGIRMKKLCSAFGATISPVELRGDLENSRIQRAVHQPESGWRIDGSAWVQELCVIEEVEPFESQLEPGRLGDKRKREILDG